MCPCAAIDRRTKDIKDVSANNVIVTREAPAMDVQALIARYNRGGRLEWCLPKGHPEGEEDHRQAAVREVEEETGIAGHILEPLGAIDYWFTVARHRVHKTVHHFLLRAVGGALSDADVEVTEVAWVPLGELDSPPIDAAGKHVVIIGGGDTGADCLGTAHRQGARSVTQLEIMPLPPENGRAAHSAAGKAPRLSSPEASGCASIITCNCDSTMRMPMPANMP